MDFLNVEIRRKVAAFGGFLVDLDNLIEQVCLEAQVAGSGILASNDKASPLGRRIPCDAYSGFLNIVALA